MFGLMGIERAVVFLSIFPVEGYFTGCTERPPCCCYDKPLHPTMSCRETWADL